ncbi:hypothetical protein LTR56_015500 [Elasticomyces elasticus]|nr:hypothetical protein LTR56_015500 [Elasticomyces elasticus]KAK3662533.1 hypothetical protein LTR22_006599 [Elasticomyces elasticus]KAK4927877.1 hypothetical protein LTR49_005299 [Elasticomyces elasticus]KAK5750224.1 hypothetical protein LTS12_019713 [Elasticomyces elasticus]
MAGLSADRLGHPQFARPPLQSQHSNSVPSTPYQQPRDMRYTSRSPSPHRGLSNQSPRSVVSEAVAHQNGAPRHAAGFCKFEIGPESKRRRIPYAEGGEHELGPPKKEPKKSLAPHEEKKLSYDMRELYDRLLPSDESEIRRAQLIQKLKKMMKDEWPGNDIQVNVFGSSGNLLSSSDSDVDICITTTKTKLESMHALAILLDRHGMKKVECRAGAKVPIVKCWDPELMLACDLNVNNPLALENTRMIKTYVQLDDRIRPLAKIIKYWTKRRILNDAAGGGTISSYTWICMIISFLQRRSPPIIPSLQKTEGKRAKCERSEPSKFADDLDALKGCGDANKETSAQLLFHFFRHYGYEFDYSKFVVSVREGRTLSREEKGWQPSNYHDKEARSRLCVEEPFTTTRNLGNTADDYSWSGIHTEIRRAFDLLADGQQLDVCCDQYEFPSEENRPIFQRPPAKPAPTLRRSASQSGRPVHEPGSVRPSRKNNTRNQSAQRSGTRRASSGASFGNQRVPMPMQSPPIGLPVNDYFARGNVHEYLSHQYQMLQQQRDVLTAQLQQQQQQGPSQGQQCGRVGDLTGSPHHRGGAFQNGLPSPRFLENPPQTAPLLPGYLYHYPARYPPPSPMSQARSREGTNTNPSSPSLMAATPTLRRQVHRASITDGSSNSVRSQSQPGRSLPHLLALQQQVHPGYDVSGAIPASYQNMRLNQMYSASGQGGLQLQYAPPVPALPSMNGSTDTAAMPKEYMGYAISPQFGPQYAVQQQHMQVPPMTLRDPPQRSRRVTPDLQPPTMNGKHSTRSPSPLGHLRSYSTISDLRSRSQAIEMLTSPTRHEMSLPVAMPVPLPPRPVQHDMGGPLIVNGSTPPVLPKPVASPNGTSAAVHPELLNGALDQELSRIRSLPLRTNGLDQLERVDTADRPRSPQRHSPSVRAKQGPRLSLSPNGTSPVINGLSEALYDPPPLTAPLLSPVAELRTPSPTQAHLFDRQESPRTANGLFIAATQHMAHARHAENSHPPGLNTRHDRQPSVPGTSAAASGRPAKSPTSAMTPISASGNTNPWQQASTGKKNHKKSKSTSVPVARASGAQPLPLDASERKGG